MWSETLAVLALLLASYPCVAAAPDACDIIASRLRVEHVENPLGITVLAPRLSWWLTAAPPLVSPPTNQSQSAYQVIVASSQQLATKGVGDMWDTGRVAVQPGVGGTGLRYAGKPVAALGTRVYWRVRVWDAGEADCGFSPETGWWEVGPVTPADWQGAEWLAQFAGPLDPAYSEGCGYYSDHPMPLFRLPFGTGAVSGGMARAVLHIAGLGYFRASVDGTVVGTDALAGPWTNYSSRVMFSSYDVTALLAGGNASAQHVLGVELGSGWWNPAPLLFWGSHNFRQFLNVGDQPMFIALLVLTSATGSQSYVTSQAAPRIQPHVSTPAATSTNLEAPVGWAVGNSSTLFDNVYLGVRVDSRLQQDGWNMPVFTPTSPWSAPAAADYMSSTLGTLVWASVPAVTVHGVFIATARPPPGDGSLVYDLGTNIAGVANISVVGPAGAVLVARYGELLYPNGSVNGMTSVAGQIKSGNGGPCAPQIAFQEDFFVLRGDPAGESFVPAFTWHGFQFVALWWLNVSESNTAPAPTVTSVVGLQMYVDVERVSSFSSSSQLLNSVYDMCVVSQAGNLVNSGVQSDCPHRERLGYGGDAAATAEAMMLNFDMAAMNEKRVLDFNADVRPGGGFTETAPFVGLDDAGFGNGSGPVGWGWAQPLLQLSLLEYYDSTDVLLESYNYTRSWMDLLSRFSSNNTLNAGLGDWSSLQPMSLVTTGTGFYYTTAVMLSQFATILGYAEDAETYSALAADIAAGYTDKYLNQSTGVFNDGTINGTQCMQSMPLYFNMLPPSTPPSVVDAIVAQCHASASNAGDHFAGGMFSLKWWLLELSSTGAHASAADAMLQTSFPSFGYMLSQNATSVWEVWSFSDNVYSHNHAMMTSVTEWATKAVVGLQQASGSTGWRRAVVWPQPLPGVIDAAAGHYASRKGVYNVSWDVAPSAGTGAGAGAGAGSGATIDTGAGIFAGSGMRVAAGNVQLMFTLNVTVPVDASALVVLPAGDVAESGVGAVRLPASDSNMRALPAAALLNTTVLLIGSGQYTFQVLLPNRAAL